MKKFLSFVLLFFACLSFAIYINNFDDNDARAAQKSTKIPDTVVVGGDVFGVKLYTKGPYIVGITYVDTKDGRTYPAKDSGLKIGDYITEINNVRISCCEDIEKNIKTGDKVSLKIRRDDSFVYTELKPSLSSTTGEYKIGAWVRDSTAGIGTVTFYDEGTNRFAALGHGIADADTGKILNVREGYIYNAYVTSVRKSQKNYPGELIGNFEYFSTPAGEVYFNSDKGIYGKVVSVPNHIRMKTSPASKVHTGPAYILSTVNSDKIEKYDVEIVKATQGNGIMGRGMVVKITDSNLLSKTNGIVQGMSGSPIIQDDRIVGALTHVFVNNPTKGYGVYIEDMLSTMFNTDI